MYDYRLPLTFAGNTRMMLHNDQIIVLYEVLGSRIREEREKANFNQSHFAQLLQISRASLVNIEKGRQRTPIHVLYEISRILQISITSLLPDLNEIVTEEVKKDIQEKIVKTSAGDQDLQQKLMDFVKSHTIAYKQ